MSTLADAALKKPYLPELDGIRAIAALLIVTNHLALPFGGFLGVPLFFVLSGYLITMLALREEDARGQLDLRGFYIRRCFRIFPIYFVLLGLHFAWFFLFGFGRPAERAFFAEHWAAYVFYFQEFLPYQQLVDVGFDNLFAQSWSLGIEEKFYLVWPLLCFVLLRPRKPLRTWMAAGLCGLFALSAFGPLQRMLFGYHQILIGCLIALYLHRRAPAERPATFSRPGFLFAAWGLLLCVQGLAQRNDNYAIFYAPVFAFALIGLLSGESWIKRLLATPVLAYLGRISYGMYLTHMIAIELVDAFGLRIAFESPLLNACVGFVATVAVVVALSSVLHFTIERPLIQLGRRLAQRQPAF